MVFALLFLYTNHLFFANVNGKKVHKNGITNKILLYFCIIIQTSNKN